MNGQIADLALEGVAEALRLILGPFQRDGHVAQGQQTGLGVQILRHIGRKDPGCKLEHGKGQHVRGTVNLARGIVDDPDPLIVGDKHVDFAGNRHPLSFQSRRNAAVQMDGQCRGHIPLVGVANQNFMFHRSTSFCKVSSVPEAASSRRFRRRR